MNTDHLWQAFKDGAQIEDATWGTILLRQRGLGDLVLSTGQIVACDPLVFAETPAFHRTIPPGRYPVIVSEAFFSANNDVRIAYARLQCGEREPVRWELATLTGQDITTLGDGEFYGYPVDAGCACFMDIDAAAGLQRRLNADREYSGSYAESLVDALSAGVVDISFNSFTGANAIMFFGGWGDGYYPSYWGYNADEKVTCLLTDFCLFNHPALKSRPPRRRWTGRLALPWRRRS